MKLEHSFTVPVDADAAFRILRDVEMVAPCMPGAALESVDGDDFTGKVKVKVGPIQVTYRGEASFTEVDASAHTATIVAKGKEARGSGTAQATVHAQLEESDGSTTVVVTTDLTVTGKPAQFGRGVMADVGEKLLSRFAACLEEKINEGEVTPEAAGTARAALQTDPAAPQAEPAGDDGAEGTEPSRAADVPASAAATEAAATTAAATSAPPPRRRVESDEPEAIDLLEVAGGPVARAAAPVVAGLALLALIIWLIRRR